MTESRLMRHLIRVQRAMNLQAWGSTAQAIMQRRMDALENEINRRDSQRAALIDALTLNGETDESDSNRSPE